MRYTNRRILYFTDELDHDASAPATRPQAAAAAAAAGGATDDEEERTDDEIESASENSGDELQQNMATADDVSDKSPG